MSEKGTEGTERTALEPVGSDPGPKRAITERSGAKEGAENTERATVRDDEDRRDFE